MDECVNLREIEAGALWLAAASTDSTFKGGLVNIIAKFLKQKLSHLPSDGEAQVHLGGIPLGNYYLGRLKRT